MLDPTPAPRAPIPPAGPPVLVDALPGARPFRLGGWVERHGFHPALTALIVFVLAFVVFNVVGSLVIGIGVMADLVQASPGVAPTAPDVLTALQAALETRPMLVLSSNTLGQILAFAVFALLAARLSTRDVKPFLRLRMPDASGLGLAALGWAVLYPIVLWAGELNAKMPLPESIRALEDAQTEMIEQLLTGADLGTGFLLIAIALTPAICEELLFRGYLHRQVERFSNAAVAIGAIGVVFGLYHLRLTQVLPLSMLGVYLGFVVWATGSVWTGAAVHLLNNGLAVLATAYISDNPDLDLEAVESASVPWFVVLGCAVALTAVCRWILARRRAVTGGRADAQPVGAPTAHPLSTPLPA